MAIILLILISLLLRLFRLAEMPPGLTNDEVTYIYNAYSVAKSGYDITGQLFPSITHIMVPFLPVPTILIAPFVGFFDLNMFWGRFPVALLGTFEVILVYILSLKLFYSKKISFFAALALAVSPWHLQLTRSAYDVPVTVFFYLVAIIALLYYQDLKTVKNKILLAFLILINLFLALFSYRAMNLLFLPLAVVSFWFISYKIKNRREIFVWTLGILLVFFSYLFIVKQQGAYYFNEAINFETPLNFKKAEEVVKHEITNTNAPIWLSRIFINKLTYSFRLFRENFLGAFSTEYLFTKGEANSIYAIWWRGMLYLIDLPFIILGFIFLFQKYKRGAFFITLLLLIGAIPASLSGPTGVSYVARAFFMIPIWAIFIGGGLAYFLILIKRFPALVKTLLILFLVLIYSYQVGGYLFQYYNRYSIYGAEAWFKSTLDLSKLLAENKDKKIYLANASVFEVINYAFYTKTNPVLVQKTYKEAQGKRHFYLNNIDFAIDCLGYGEKDPKTFLPSNTVYITRSFCHKDYEANEYIRRYNGRFTEGSEIIWRIYKSPDLSKK